MKKVLIILFLFSSTMYGQQAEVDSLISLLPELKDTEKVDVLVELSFIYRNIDVQKGLVYGSQAMDLAESLSYKKGLADANSRYGLNLIRSGKTEEGLENYKKAHSIYEEINDKEGLASITNNLGLFYSGIGDQAEGLSYLQQSLKLSEALDIKQSAARALNNIGLIYTAQGTYDKALEYLLRSLKLKTELNSPINSLAITHSNLGVIYMNLEDYDKAIEQYEKARQIQESIGNKNYLAQTLHNIGLIYDKQNKYNQAIAYFEESLRLRRGTGNETGIANSYNSIGRVYNNMGDLERALTNYRIALESFKEVEGKWGQSNTLINIAEIYAAQNNSRRAESHLHEALKIALKINANTLLQRAYKHLSDIYVARNNYKEAFTYFQHYFAARDSVISEETNNKIAELQIRFETEQKEKEIALLTSNIALNELEIKRQETMKYSAFAGSAFLFVVLGLVYYLFRIKHSANIIIGEKNKELEVKIGELEHSLNHIKTLEGLLPICANCKQIRLKGENSKDQKNWVKIEKYISDRTDAVFSHGICPKCEKDLYGDFLKREV